jgi:hypothetical protein
MDDYLAVYEFTGTGELAPADPIEWRCGEDCPVGFEAAGLINDDAISAEFFQETGTGRVLVHLSIFGVATPVLCSTRASFVRFARDWLAPLTKLNRPQAIDDLRQSIIDTKEAFEEVGFSLAEISAELAKAQPAKAASTPLVETTATSQAVPGN